MYYWTEFYFYLHFFLNINFAAPFAGGKEPAEWHTIQVPGDDVNHRLSQLEPKKDFAVKIQAVSDRGPGVVSEPQYIRTLPKGK